MNSYKEKKSISVFAAHNLTEGQLGDTLASLPANSLVINAYANVGTKSSTVGAVVDVKIGGVKVNTGIAVDAAGYSAGTAAPTNFNTGGAVVVAKGATAPAGGKLVLDVFIEYIEYTKSTGELTN